MNILFILGNGFDINLGLHTSYQEYYDYYLKQPTDDQAVAMLKDYLKKARYTTWADLELGLGSYTTRVANLEQMKKVYFDLDDKLHDFLRNEEQSFSSTDIVTQAVTIGLTSPQLFLPQGMREAINDIRRGQNPYMIDVITFNYTNTLEKALSPYKKVNSQIQLSDLDFLRSVNHIHMSLSDDDVIMGVNDETQIHNQSLIDDELRSLIVKPYINEQLQNLIDLRCGRLIKEADLICLFGVSVGETDSMWWKAIGERFTKTNIRIILFAYEKSNIAYNYDRISKIAQWKDTLFDRMGILGPTGEQKGRVFIGYKTDLFKVK